MFSTNDEFIDLYVILGIDKNSTYRQIKKAYNQKVLKYHPDKNKTAEATTMFRLVHNAYEILSDKEKRQEYDNKIAELSIAPCDKDFADTQNISKPSKIDDTLLFDAIHSGNVDKVSKLIASGANVNFETKNGPPLFIAAKFKSINHTKILQILLKHKADPNFTYYHQTAMDIAGCAGNVEAFSLLVPITNKKNIVVNILGITEYPWYTDIMYSSATSPDWFNILKIIKNHGADLNQKSIYGESILDVIVRTLPSSTYAMNEFLEHEGKYYTSPHMLDNTLRDEIHDSQRKFFKGIELIDFVMDNGLNPITTSTKNGRTFLHDLIDYKNLDYVVNGYAKIIDRCLLKGFNINTADAYGRTLLHIAAYNGNFKALKYLIARGADLNARNKNGHTPLHEAAGGNFSQLAEGHLICIDILIEYGADSTIRDEKGLSPQEYSKLRYTEWMKSESYKNWGDKAKNAWRSLFNQASCRLSISTSKPESQRFFSAFTQKTLDYINIEIEIFKSRKITLALLESLPLEKKHKELLENYRDEVSHELIEIPVILNARVYDLRTLFSILERDKKDPFTGEFFDISDIDPALEVRERMDALIQFLESKYSKLLLELKESQVDFYQSNTNFGPYFNKKLTSEIQPRISLTLQKNNNQYHGLFSDKKSKIMEPESDVEMLETINHCVLL